MNRCTKVGTTDGPMDGSLESQPLRSRFCEAVTSSAWAVAAGVPGRAPLTAGRTPTRSASPAAAVSRRRLKPWWMRGYPRACIEGLQVGGAVRMWLYRMLVKSW